MNLFNLNYNKLQNLKQIEFNIFIYLIIIVLGILIILAFNIEVYKINEYYGIYENDKLNVKINNKLSENIKNIEYIVFKSEKSNIKKVSFLNYEIVDNNILENVEIELDNEFSNNEIGLVKFYYGKQKLIKYIFELFR